MTDSLRVSQVFVPGKMPQYTYNPRSNLKLESQLVDYLDEGGAILTLSGPTKTGKTVLVNRVVQKLAAVEGQGIESVDQLWERVVDAQGAFTKIELGNNSSTGGGGSIRSGVNVGIASFGVAGDLHTDEEQGTRFSVVRPVSALAREALARSGAALVIDDFHFIDRPVQTQIVRALKPLVLAGVPIVLVSISHRVQDVVNAEPDMTGRVASIKVEFWSQDELVYIAREGLKFLNVRDDNDLIASRLADMSYGSPHLMQRFCREICKFNGVRESLAAQRELTEPDSWDDFFEAQTDEASAEWFRKLLRGAQERGSSRTKWETKEFGALDYYGVTLAAIAKTGPKPALTKDEIKASAEAIVVGTGPAANQITRALIHMSKIAATRMGTTAPTDEELDADVEEHLHDVQPVLEYVDDGPSSMLYIADPFFAHFVRFGGAGQLRAAGDKEQVS